MAASPKKEDGVFSSGLWRAGRAFGILLESAVFVLAIESIVAAVLWLLHHFFPRPSTATPAWISWSLQEVYKRPEPVYFLNILRIVLNTLGSKILIVLTAAWTFIRMHKRLDNVEIEN